METGTFVRAKTNSNLPEIAPGDTVKVSFRVKEANRERVQVLQGLVVRIRRGGGGGSFTIRKVAYGVGVEHTFPFNSPFLEKIEVVRRGKVRRAKLYYIRRLSARESRLKERREKMAEAVVAEVATGESEQTESPVENAETGENA
jgi:large subunit ribosomal protein L19